MSNITTVPVVYLPHQQYAWMVFFINAHDGFKTVTKDAVAWDINEKPQFDMWVADKLHMRGDKIAVTFAKGDFEFDPAKRDAYLSQLTFNKAVVLLGVESPTEWKDLEAFMTEANVAFDVIDPAPIRDKDDAAYAQFCATMGVEPISNWKDLV